MKVVITGGSGQVGAVLARAFVARGGGETIIVSRNRCTFPGTKWVGWDGQSASADQDWTHHIDGADVVINLAGRSVNCRYNQRNRELITQSRVKSTLAVAEAIKRAAVPPPLWLQMSTATIYAHRFDAPNDEENGIIGGSAAERDAPDTWRFSIEVATAWERAVDDADLPATRKVKMRSAMVMSPDRGGIFDTLLRLVRFGLGGTCGSGKQFVSWIADEDFVRAVLFLIEHEKLAGAVNISSPNPVPNAEFMRTLRKIWGAPVGLPANELMLEVGAVFLKTETELILKSRRVYPGKLLDAGFEFHQPEWSAAATDLCKRWRNAVSAANA